jgi:hypothetical protein
MSIFSTDYQLQSIIFGQNLLWPLQHSARRSGRANDFFAALLISLNIPLQTQRLNASII